MERKTRTKVKGDLKVGSKELVMTPLAKPSGWPGLGIEFYHMGKQLCVSVERAKRLVNDINSAIKAVEAAKAS